MFTTVNTLFPAAHANDRSVLIQRSAPAPRGWHLLGVPTGRGGPVHTPNTAPHRVWGATASLAATIGETEKRRACKVAQALAQSTPVRPRCMGTSNLMLRRGEAWGSAALPRCIRQKGDASLPESAEVYRGKPPHQNMDWRKSKTSATKALSAGRSGITVKL